ncbi:MAG: WecB/TagA/CpsF family glycosyltransferase [Planctomycetota bacterium]|nr:WecB/TagA/CpsF family glycosyltransferase [Planctomycetota bacterium]
MSQMLQDEPELISLPFPATQTIRASARSLISLFGVHVDNIDMRAALDLLEQAISGPRTSSKGIYFVNASTLNLASEHPEYRELLNRGFRVFGDGTGVRWAARWQGKPMKANLNGTDLVPELFERTAGQGYRYYLLGATDETIQRAAANAQRRFPGWNLVGWHHGYVDAQSSPQVIEQINAAQPHLLLVGMGNPLQENWIDRYLPELDVPLCMGTGGLFDHWAGNLRRASRLVRYAGYEWLQLLLQQPHKWRRYLLGNPLFLWRMVKYGAADQAETVRLAQDCVAEAALAAGHDAVQAH